MDISISIIIPVYNVEKYLEECVDSIISQDFENKEIILVNDGSTDNSPAICDEYAKKHDCIRVVHKENGGLSDARNAGLKEAKNQYILFVDSDDYIAKNSLKAIARVADSSRADVILLEAKKFFPDGTSIGIGDGITADKVRNLSCDEALSNLSEAPKFPASACTKLIKRELFLKNENLLFKKGLLSEDIDWSLKLFCIADTFDYCDIDYYYYRQNRQGSITNTLGSKNISDFLYILKKWSEISKQLSPSQKKFVLSNLSYEYPIALACYGGLEKKEKQAFYETIKSFRWLLKVRKGTRYLILNILTKLFGINFTSGLLNIYLRIR
ncbi:MAG: glycosyltransferase family 2 protein [Ruminococcaceae bacterium]|nr:glycosyltransferase family 2 protein [Oscillospiraceae bacterium]